MKDYTKSRVEPWRTTPSQEWSHGGLYQVKSGAMEDYTKSSRAMEDYTKSRVEPWRTTPSQE